jgi:hypothetical protein
MTWRIATAGLAAAAVLATVGVSPSQSQTAPAFDAVFQPVRDGGPDVTAIVVRSTVRGAPADKPLVLNAPVVYAGVYGVADRVKDLTVTDGRGAVALTVSEDKPVPGGFPYFRHWTTARPVAGPVSITYRSLVQAPDAARGPPFGIRAVGGGVSGATSGFLVYPTLPPGEIRMAWDLSDLPAGSAGISSWGEGATTRHGVPQSLTQAWIIAGPVARYPAAGKTSGFSAAWLGQAPFDAPAEMEWASRLYAYLGKSFRYLDPPPPYRVFMRFLPGGGAGGIGGTALPQSFMLSATAGEPKPGGHAPHGTLAHEMIHQWSGGIVAPDGVSSWFSEGLTVYYTALLPKRGGFAALDDYAREINAIAKGYYAFPAREWSAAKIAEAGFGDENIRHIPYDRSALYFADLDARIRAKSGGKRRLEDALQPLFQSREKGVRFDHDAWRAFVVREIGPDAAAEWEKTVLDGKLFVPRAHAFGPCFELRPKTYAFQGADMAGYEWMRVAGIPDAKCLSW